MLYIGTEVVLQPPPISTVDHTVPSPLVGGGTGVPVAVGCGEKELPILFPLELALGGLVVETNPEWLQLLGVYILHEEGVLLLGGDGDQVGVADVAVLAGLGVGQRGVLVEVAEGAVL